MALQLAAAAGARVYATAATPAEVALLSGLVGEAESGDGDGDEGRGGGDREGDRGDMGGAEGGSSGGSRGDAGEDEVTGGKKGGRRRRLVDRIIDTSKEDLRDAIMEETGQVGVSLVVDDGEEALMSRRDLRDDRRGGGISVGGVGTVGVGGIGGIGDAADPSRVPLLLSSVDIERREALASKVRRTIMECLAVHGHWATTRMGGMELNPAEARLLTLKNASVSFMFHHAWLLAPARQGEFLHMMHAVLDKIEDGSVCPLVGATMPVGRLAEALDMMHGVGVIGGATHPAAPLGRVVVRFPRQVGGSSGGDGGGGGGGGVLALGAEGAQKAVSANGGEYSQGYGDDHGSGRKGGTERGHDRPPY
jgi:NADPH:quinone reductase-like Zn-dependent oxidoreductase